jgi:hypothetical protein
MSHMGIVRVKLITLAEWQICFSLALIDRDFSESL